MFASFHAARVYPSGRNPERGSAAAPSGGEATRGEPKSNTMIAALWITTIVEVRGVGMGRAARVAQAPGQMLVTEAASVG